MNSMDLEQSQDQDNRRDEAMRQEQAATNTREQSQQTLVERAHNASVEWTLDAIKMASALAQECKEGAIEDRRNTIAEEVCARFTNALGADAARSLGQGAAKIVLHEPDGMEQTVKAAVTVAFEIAQDIGAVRTGELPALLTERAIQDALQEKMRESKARP